MIPYPLTLHYSPVVTRDDGDGDETTAKKTIGEHEGMTVRIRHPQSNIVSQLKSIGLPFLLDIAQCDWLAAWLLSMLSQITHGYRKLWHVPAQFSARFHVMIGTLEIKFGTRWETVNGRLCTACALRVVRV